MKTQADYKYLLDRKRGRLSSLLNALRMFAHNRRERKILNQPLRWD